MASIQYISYHFNLSDNQMRRFAGGKKIRIKHADLLGGPDLVFLTATQGRKVETAKKHGKGVDLVLSTPQREYHVRHGAGRFGDFFKSIGRNIRNGSLSVAQRVGSLGVDALGNVAGSFLKGKIPSGRLQDFVDAGVKAGANFTKEQLVAYLEGLKQTRNGGGLKFKLDNHMKILEPISTYKLLAPPKVSGQGLYLTGQRKEGRGLYLTGR